MMIMIAQLMNSKNDNCDDEHLNDLFFYTFRPGEKSSPFLWKIKGFRDREFNR